jgi:8-amino-3,8-dideoxy-alpha-D-manno-octulosonate transaminase
MAGEEDWIGFAGARAISDEEREAVASVLSRRTLYRGRGLAPPEEASLCEAELAELLGRRYVVLMNSGTSALLAALRAVGVGPGDEVILPGYGWLTDVTTVLHLGAVPVFAPLGPDLNLDPARLEACFSERTRAVAPVHACGRPFDLPAVAEIARRRGVPLVEDACQCLGGRIDGRLVGTEGQAAVFSFQAFKIVTAGEGGAMATDDEALYLSALRFHDAGLARFSLPSLSRSRAGPEGQVPVGVGLNLRMSELGAALLRVQLRRLPELLGRLTRARTALLETFSEAFAAGVLRACPPRQGVEENGTFLQLKAPDARVARRMTEALCARGVPVRLAAAAPLHALPGWLEYLDRHGYAYRVVDRESSLDVLNRTLLLEVNWEQSPDALQRLRGDVAWAVGRIGSGEGAGDG